ncbi:hypothetical protein GCM10027613_46330 [Microlunatus endophyticus]
MQITALETFIVEPRWLFLAVRTDEGITGWGEPIVEGKAATVAAAIRELSGFLIGKDPSPIEDHWQTLIKGGFYRGGPVLSSAVAGIDQALWDIKGKALGLPIHELLGGPVRQRQRIYGWIGGDEPGQLAESARQRVEQGYDAVKMNGGGKMRALESRAEIKGIVERVAAVRDAVGDAVDIGIDFHGRFSPRWPGSPATSSSRCIRSSSRNPSSRSCSSTWPRSPRPPPSRSPPASGSTPAGTSARC